MMLLLTRRQNTIKEHWKEYLALELWADRISVRRSTGYSAFELVYGREYLLPAQFSWCMIDWEVETKTREDLSVVRIRRSDQRILGEARAVENLERPEKDYFEEHKRL